MSKKIDAAARLLAAEAEYLSACSWKPVVFLGGKIAWVDFKNPESRYTQEEAGLADQVTEGRFSRRWPGKRATKRWKYE